MVHLPTTPVSTCKALTKHLHRRKIGQCDWTVLERTVCISTPTVRLLSATANICVREQLYNVECFVPSGKWHRDEVTRMLGLGISLTDNLVPTIQQTAFQLAKRRQRVGIYWTPLTFIWLEQDARWSVLKMSQSIFSLPLDQFFS